MPEEITYIGSFDNEPQDIEKNKETKSSIKINRRNNKLRNFIYNSKKHLINKNVIVLLLIVALIYFFNPVTFLKGKLEEKREYYALLSEAKAQKKDVDYKINFNVKFGGFDSLKYMVGADYYKKGYNTMTKPADGLMTCHYDLGHRGIDICCEEYPGNIYAAATGTVKDIGYNEKYGNYILLKHKLEDLTIYTYYGNLSTINVTNGQFVFQNQVIGLEGGDGSYAAKIGEMESKGHHIHFEVRKEEYGRQLDPIIFIQL